MNIFSIFDAKLIILKMKFIEVIKTNGESIIINAAHIVKIEEYNYGAVICLSNEKIFVNDTYNSLKTQICKQV